MKRPQQAPLIASAGQKRIWLVNQLNPDSVAYNMTSSFDYKGELELERLKDSLFEIVARHDALRTVFRWENGELFFEIRDEIRPDIIVSETEDIESSTTEHARTIFNLGEGPLLKMVVLKQGIRCGRILLVIHHIVFDEWSLKIFWKEFQNVYNSTEASDTRPFAFQYSDFAFWHNEQLKRNAYATQLEYWETQLQGVPGIIELPTISARSRNLTDKGAISHLQVNIETSKAIRILARKMGISISTVLLTGFKILINRYSNTDDFVIGIPIANRRKAEFSETIGFFLNTAAIRSNLKNNFSLKDALESTHKTVLAAIENQDIPFDEIIDTVKPERMNGRLPLVQTMFVYQKGSDAKPNLSLDGVLLENVFSDTRSAKLDLTLFAIDTDNRIELFFEYKEELFEFEIIEQMLGHYRNLLHSMTANIDGRLADLEIIPPSEKRIIIERSIGERIPIGETPLLPEQIAEHSYSTPDSIAIETESNAITYSQLICRADSLSAQLIAAGATHTRPIALYLDRSIDAIVAILAILRSGSHYLPLDPEYPINRTFSILEDAQPIAIITKNEYQSRLEGITNIPIITSNQASESTQSIASAADRNAYIIYTSGSTGKPKGVAISHDNLRYSTFARSHYYGSSPQRFLLLSSLSFDSSVAAIFWTLSSGGTLVLPKQGEEKDPEVLCNLISSHHVSTLLCIPSLYREILNTNSNRLSSLQLAIVAGEDCPQPLLNDHYEKLPHCSLHNEYGPTEATVWCTATKLEAGKSVMIGKPIANYKTFVLNTQLQLQPDGVPGELHISGPALAKGYINDEQTSKTRFITSDLPTRRKVRMYKTGDLVKRHPNGSLEFLGRIDGQLKIRGFRLELGEVTSTLKRIPSIRDVTLKTIEEPVAGHSSTRLIAFVIPFDKTKLDSQTLRAILAKELPSHAIPSQFVFLDHFPFLPNGKIDHKSLPIPSRKIERETGLLQPTSTTEVKLVSIWKEVLGLSNVSINDNYFDLGGTSLQAIRLFTRIKTAFSSKLSAGELLQAPTIERLAKRIEVENKTFPFKCLVTLKKGKNSPPIFLIHSGGLQVLFYKDLASKFDDKIPLHGLQPVGHDGSEKPLQNIQAMVERYLSEITLIHPNGPYVLIGHCFGVTVALEMAKTLENRGMQVPLVVSIDGETPLPMDHVAEKKEKDPLPKQPLGKIAYTFYRFIRRTLKPLKEYCILNYGDPDKRADLLIQKTGEGLRKAYHNHRSAPYLSKVLAFHCLDSDVWVNHSKKDWLRVAPNLEMVEAQCLHNEILIGKNAQATANAIMDALVSINYYSPDEPNSQTRQDPKNSLFSLRNTKVPEK